MARKKLKKITIQFFFNISLHFTEIDTMVRSVDNQVYQNYPFLFFVIYFFTIHRRQI